MPPGSRLVLAHGPRTADLLRATGQPLLQEVYFLERALDPYVSLNIGDRETVLNRNTAVLLIPDNAAPSANDREEIAKWIERGGIAVRSAMGFATLPVIFSAVTTQPPLSTQVHWPSMARSAKQFRPARFLPVCSTL